MNFFSVILDFEELPTPQKNFTCALNEMGLEVEFLIPIDQPYNKILELAGMQPIPLTPKPLNP